MQDLDFRSQPNRTDEAFERRLDQALMAAPKAEIPPDFAARVAGLVPPRPPLAASRPAYARISTFVSAIVLFFALLLLAPHAAKGSIFAIALDWILGAELSVLALSLALAGAWLPVSFRSSAR